ncbi:3'-5' exonuclease [Vibrio fluvialis]|nr:3'-5' exonuclease [Vibrio fluvialis]
MEKMNVANTVIIDTETTGLDDSAQIIELTAVCAQSGTVLFSSLLRPTGWIPEEATAIHGITNADVSKAPRFVDIIEPLFGAIAFRDAIMYNSDFDSRMFIQSYERSYQLTSRKLRFQYGMLKQKLLNARCAMRWYAEFYGAVNPLYGSFAWQRLTAACTQQNIDVSDLTAHRALADCEMTRRLIHAVNGKLEG